MLPRLFRLSKEQDFERVLKYGRSFFTGPLKWKIIKNNLPCSRFGIVLSNRVIKKATQRNKIKRWIRAILLKHLKQISGGFDAAIICRPGIEKENHQTLSLNIKNSLIKIHLLY